MQSRLALPASSGRCSARISNKVPKRLIFVIKHVIVIGTIGTEQLCRERSDKESFVKVFELINVRQRSCTVGAQIDINYLNDGFSMQTQDMINNDTQTEPSKVEADDKTEKFTRPELKRIHRPFGHASARKLYNLVIRSWGVPPPNALAELENIVVVFQVRTEFAPHPVSFRVRLPGHVIFNHSITLDLVWLLANRSPPTRANRPCLLIVDMGTGFNSACFIEFEFFAAIWNAFVKAWCAIYIRFPNIMLVYQGSSFLSNEWRSACDLNSIELIATGTESHNSLGAGESYHAYLRRVYKKKHKGYPTVEDEIILAISIKAINDYTGRSGLARHYLY